MIDLILYDVRWRKMFNSFVRVCVGIFIVILIVFSVIMDKGQNRAFKNEHYNDYIFIHGEAGSIGINALKKELAKLPDWLMEQYINDGGTITLSSISLDKVKEEFYGGRDGAEKLGGMYTLFDGVSKIWIYNDRQAIKEVTLHEFGHYMDKGSLFISNTDAFLEIYKQEKTKFLLLTWSRYQISTSSEYFAESFQWYFNSPRLLRAICPKTYVFMDDLIYSP